MNDSGCTCGTGEYRSYGNSPYEVVVIHGGPGAPGSMGVLARAISDGAGVLEPFQSAHTISGQVEELYSLIHSLCGSRSVSLIGHSWGAWLGFIFAAKYVSLVEKLILVSAGSFDASRNAGLAKTRLERLNPDERGEVMRLSDALNRNPAGTDPGSAFKRFEELMSKADSYAHEIPRHDNDTEVAEASFQPEVYRSVWREAEEMRDSGALLQLGTLIKCPVVAIHGDHDPHPAEGVRNPLSNVLNDFKFILLKRCGHSPWREKYARDEFFKIIKKELFKDSERDGGRTHA